MSFLQDCSDLTARTHIYYCKKVKRPQLFYKVDLGLWHSGCVHRAETISDFQAKVSPLNTWGRIDRQLWVPTLEVTAWHWNANLYFQMAPVSHWSALPKAGEGNDGTAHRVSKSFLCHSANPHFDQEKRKSRGFFNLYQYIQSLWFGILTFSHLPSPVWTFVGHIMESPCARDVLLRDVNNSH